MLLIIVYHFLEVNAKDDDSHTSPSSTASSSSASNGKSPSSSASTDKRIPANADPVGFSPAAAVASRGTAGKAT